MAAGAMASFISRVSSFLLAAATLSATNQPLNNQHHHQHHQLQQQQQQQQPQHLSHHHQHHSQAHDHHQPQHQVKFHHQPPMKHQQHFLPATFPLLANPQQRQYHHHHHHHHHEQQQAPLQHLTNRATVSFGPPDLASSSTSRASNTLAGAVAFTGGHTNFVGSPPSGQMAASASPSSSSSSSSALVPPAAPASGQASAYSAPPASSVFDVFEYVMHYKPSTPLISPSSIAFSTIPINSNNKHQRHHQAAGGGILQSAGQSLSPPASPQHQHQQQLQLQQQNRRQQPSSLQVQAPSQQPQPHHHHQQQKQPQQQLQRQTASNGSFSSLLEISRSSTSSNGNSNSNNNNSSSSFGRGILSRFSLLQPNNQQQQQRREDVCGKTMQTPQRRIIGGEGARYGEFPYQVHIKIAKHQCGGALIDKQSIVTAAHCVYHFMTRAPVSKLQIVIGAYDIEDEQFQELPPQYFKVNKVKLHPQFRFSASHPDRYDIAILKLDKPVKYTDNVLPVCLPNRDLKFESMIGTVTGFGKTDPSLSNRYGTRLLQKVDVPIIENNECERWHRTRGIDLKIFPEMMCAGYEDGLKDACVGDSGGPLVVKTGAGPDGSFRWTLAGITSAGFGCAQSRQPGIYHRVSHTVDWILENLD